MKLHLGSAIFFTAFLLSSYTFANNFSVQEGAPTITHSLELQQYVTTVSAYSPETTELNVRLQKIKSYYSNVHILKTVNKKNYTIDCIPFAEQPALIDNPTLAKQLLPIMMNTTQNNIDNLKKMGTHFEFNAAAECPLGSVAILRPSKTMLTSEISNKKAAPHAMPASPLIAGYTWEQGVTPNGDLIFIPTQASQAYFKGPQNQYVTSNNQDDHSLNQFWYTTDILDHPHKVLTYSVEFGIIASAYFTNTPATSIFVFASIDNYGPNSCYNLLCPNFIQAPGTSPIGVPITNKNVDYIFQVKHTTTPGFQPGYYLTLVSHDSLNSQNNASTLLGYYPDSLYAPADRPKNFSAGAEVYADAPGDGTIMYGNYANPYVGYTGAKMIGLDTQNGNNFPYSTSMAPAPYGLIWNLGQ